MEYLVFDCGGTSIKYAGANSDGTLEVCGSVSTPPTLEKFFKELDGIMKPVLESEHIQGLAFSFPGEVHSDKGDIGGISAISYIHGIPLPYGWCGEWSCSYLE